MRIDTSWSTWHPLLGFIRFKGSLLSLRYYTDQFSLGIFVAWSLLGCILLLGGWSLEFDSHLALRCSTSFLGFLVEWMGCFWDGFIGIIVSWADSVGGFLDYDLVPSICALWVLHCWSNTQWTDLDPLLDDLELLLCFGWLLCVESSSPSVCWGWFTRHELPSRCGGCDLTLLEIFELLDSLPIFIHRFRSTRSFLMISIVLILNITERCLFLDL